MYSPFFFQLTGSLKPLTGRLEELSYVNSVSGFCFADTIQAQAENTFSGMAISTSSKTST
jgi:hypothetical protein